MTTYDIARHEAGHAYIILQHTFWATITITPDGAGGCGAWAERTGALRLTPIQDVEWSLAGPIADWIGDDYGDATPPTLAEMMDDMRWYGAWSHDAAAITAAGLSDADIEMAIARVWQWLQDGWDWITRTAAWIGDDYEGGLRQFDVYSVGGVGGLNRRRER